MKIISQVSAGGIVYKQIKNEKLKMKNFLWLIGQHSQHKGWVFPKGLVGDKENSESMEEAALREVEEEGGVKARIITNKPIITNYQFKFQGNLIKKTVYYFLMEYISGNTKNHDWEMADAKFVTTEEVRKILTYKSDKEAFEKICNIIKID